MRFLAATVQIGPAPRSYCENQRWTSRMTDLADADRRKRIKFRAWHRGMKEVDLILGRFADASVDAMDEPGLDAFEALLEEPDPVILAWVTGGESPSPERDTDLLRRLIEFYR